MSNRKIQPRARRNPHRQPARRFVVVCEGDTEVSYFTHINQVLRGGAVVVKAVQKRTDPQNIVALAAAYKNGDPQKGIEACLADDEVWAVFDGDAGANEVLPALQEARRQGVQVAVSVPEFEVWFVWHYADYSVFGSTKDDVERQLLKHWPGYQKGISLDFGKLPRGGLSKARKRASEIEAIHKRDNRAFPTNNPSSTVHVLMEAIIQAWEESHGHGKQCPLAEPLVSQ